MLILEHKIVAVTILAIEIILIGKVSKAILIILALHLVNLSFQIRNFLIAIILPILSMRDLSVLSWLRLFVRSADFLGIFCFREMLRKSLKKFIIISVIIMLDLCSPSTKFLIRRVIALSKISVIRLQCWKNNKEPLDVWLMGTRHV